VELHESPYRLEWMEDPWDDVSRAAVWLDSLLQASRADLLHLNCYGPAMRDYDVPILLVVHSCVHSWWRAVRGCDPDPGWRHYRECVIRALCNAERVIAPTAAHLNALADCYEEVNLNGRVRVIHNGIDASRWSSARLPGARFVLGVGRVWDQAKNLIQLADVAPSLGCPVLIAGNGDLDRNGGAAGVVLLGSLPRAALVGYFRRAAAFAHPARYEPFGLAVLEAALSGCPLVLGNIATLRELWHDAALFVEPDDTRSLREHLQRLLSDPRERRRLGRAARQRALRYSATAMAAAYAEQYQQLLGPVDSPVYRPVETDSARPMTVDRP
jgi:glycosyltransferase involved in cell wall biosynthesis